MEAPGSLPIWLYSIPCNFQEQKLPGFHLVGRKGGLPMHNRGEPTTDVKGELAVSYLGKLEILLYVGTNRRDVLW